MMKKSISYTRKLILSIILFSCAFSTYAFDSYAQKKQKNNVMFFVSLGMPKLVLRQYLIQSKQIGIPLVIRGLVNNSYPDTAKRIYQVLHPKNASKESISGGFEIDPVYFRKFKINVVPALVVNSDVHSSVIYGNIPMQQLLKIMISKSKYFDIKSKAELCLEKYHA